MTELTLRRIAKRTNYTIGRLYLDGTYICDTIEDTDRALRQTDSLEQIKRVKIVGKTAIPNGTYDVTMDIVSPKFDKKYYYHTYCKGKLPRLLKVPGFEGILIHRGVDETSTEGCIIVGYNKKVGQVLYSKQAFEKLYSLLKGKNDIKISIV